MRELTKAFPHKTKTYGFEKISADTGLSLSTLQRIADGKVGPSIDTIAAIARNLGCSVADLLEESKDGLLGATAPKQSLQRRLKK
jgi:DNA-binding Xre family transcriptional regulator